MIPKELQSLRPMQGKERLGAHRSSEYLGAEDIEPGSEPILTIKSLFNGMITLARGKENHDVMVFAEEKVDGINNVRPLVVNATNRKTLRKLFKAVDASTLVGKKIQLYIVHDVRDPSTGEKVDGIRIRDKVPTGQKYVAPKCEECGQDISGMSNFTAEQIAANTKKKYGKCLCVECGQKTKEAIEAEQEKQKQAEQKAPAEEPQNDLAGQLMAEAEK